jgi:hypothetical protein
VFDEYYLVIIAVSYRAIIGLLLLLRNLAVQIIFLIGTILPFIVPEFEQSMLLRRARIIRSSTIRRDIYFYVSYYALKRDFVRDFAIPRIQEVIRGLRVSTRAIIYYSLRDIAEEVI